MYGRTDVGFSPLRVSVQFEFRFSWSPMGPYLIIVQEDNHQPQITS